MEWKCLFYISGWANLKHWKDLLDYFVESLKKIMKNKNTIGIILICRSNLFVLRVQWNRESEEIIGLMVAFFEALVVIFRGPDCSLECFCILLPACPSLLSSDIEVSVLFVILQSIDINRVQLWQCDMTVALNTGDVLHLMGFELYLTWMEIQMKKPRFEYCGHLR